MRALVTGGAGFIGSHVVHRLLTKGHDVRVIDNLSTGRMSNLDEVVGDVEFYELDIRDADGVASVARGCDVIFHLAALPPGRGSIDHTRAFHDTNLTGTLNVLGVALDVGVRRVVCGSSPVAGATGQASGSHLEALTPHDVATLAAEGYCRSLHAVHGVETVSLRYFGVFGPRQDADTEPAPVIPTLIRAFAEGRSPVIFGDGEQSQDFTYVDDAVNATVAAAEATAAAGRLYEVGSGRAVTLNEVAAHLRGEFGGETDVEYVPPRAQDVRGRVADLSGTRADLGYAPAVSLEEGLRRTVSFHREQELEFQRALARNREPGMLPRVAPPARVRHKHYLITGGAGFIGSHLAEALIERDDSARIVILDDLSTGSFENIRHLVDGDRVSFVRGSVTDAAVVDELMRDAHQCIHLASAVGVQMIVNEPLDTLMKSVRGSNVVMHSATRNNVRVLFSSTSEVYGKQSHKVLSEQDDLIFGSPSKGRWTYAIAKSFGEALIHGYHRQRGVNATIVRLFNCVGPRQTATYGMVLPRFVRQALAGEPLTVYGDGTQTRCFTHVRDTVGALLALSAHDDASGRTFNIGTGNLVSIHELAQRVIARAGSDSRITLIPYEQAYSSGFEELGTRIPDTAALLELTGWEAQCTIDDAIDDVIAYERVVAATIAELGAQSTAADAA